MNTAGDKQAMQDFEKVIICSGHMIDTPDRSSPRFPPNKETVVRQHIAQALADLQVSQRDLGISGGARGADILFAESCLERGARILLLIALPEEEFLDRSVILNGDNWEERYLALRNHPNVETRFQHERGKPVAEGLSAFESNNLWIIDTAREVANPEKLYAVLVWDEEPKGDGPGGTSDFAEEVEKLGGKIIIINPTKLSPLGGE
jgi:hypothetical protein